jgi:hypothetical protein
MSFAEDCEPEPVASPEDRLKSAMILLERDDLSLLASVAESLVKSRREVVAMFDRGRLVFSKQRNG